MQTLAASCEAAKTERDTRSNTLQREMITPREVSNYEIFTRIVHEPAHREHLLFRLSRQEKSADTDAIAIPMLGWAASTGQLPGNRRFPHILHRKFVDNVAERPHVLVAESLDLISGGV